MSIKSMSYRIFPLLLAFSVPVFGSDKFDLIKEIIDSRQLEKALIALKDPEIETLVSTPEFLLLTSFFFTESGQPSKALEYAEKAEFSTTGYESEIAEAKARAFLRQGDLSRAEDLADTAITKDPDSIMGRVVRIQVKSALTNTFLATEFERLLLDTNDNPSVWIAYLDQALRLAKADTTLPERAYVELGDTALVAEYRAQFSFKANKRYEAYQHFKEAGHKYAAEGNSIAYNRITRWLELNGKYANQPEPLAPLPTITDSPKSSLEASGSDQNDRNPPAESAPEITNNVQSNTQTNQVVIMIVPPQADRSNSAVTQSQQSAEPDLPRSAERGSLPSPSQPEMIRPAQRGEPEDVEPIKIVTNGELFTGSGFITNQGQWVVTNRHVVENANRIIVRNGLGKIRNVVKYFLDDKDDIALLYLEDPYPTEYSVALNDIIDPVGGDGLYVMGYPLTSILGTHYPSITEGIVSKEAGFGDMQNHFLVTASVNQGNSGGPIFSQDGRVLGIAVAKLDKARYLETTGSLPEDVNVGIKGAEIRRFLRSSQRPSEDSRPALSPREAYSKLRSQVVLVVSIDD